MFPRLRMPAVLSNIRRAVAGGECVKAMSCQSTYKRNCLLPVKGVSRVRSNRDSLPVGMLGICFALCFLLARPTAAAQVTNYGKEGTIDEHGNIYVSSDTGKLIKVADTTHCSVAIFAPDRQTLGCLVMQPPALDGTWKSLDLEIYLKGGRRVVIDPGTPMGDWHFWKDGEQVAICSYRPDRPILHILYDSATGQEIEKV
jgi:hypothetical protein